MIGIGMKVRFVPHFNCGLMDSQEELEPNTITGKIIYINWEHKCFAVEFKCGDTIQHESFKFCQIGSAVKVRG